MPVVFYEILVLATRGRDAGCGHCADILPLIQSVIATTQVEPRALVMLPHLAEGQERPASAPVIEAEAGALA